MTEALQQFLKSVPDIAITYNDEEYKNPEQVLRAFVQELRQRVSDEIDRINKSGMRVNYQDDFQRVYNELLREFGLEGEK